MADVPHAIRLALQFLHRDERGGSEPVERNDVAVLAASGSFGEAMPAEEKQQPVGRAEFRRGAAQLGDDALARRRRIDEDDDLVVLIAQVLGDSLSIDNRIGQRGQSRILVRVDANDDRAATLERLVLRRRRAGGDEER